MIPKEAKKMAFGSKNERHKKNYIATRSDRNAMASACCSRLGLK